MPKKGRTFQCVGFDGCNMSFTRSEHLARHIRKHTGERPFNCQHCNRKFSRLDNLRQHKQTVHVYENFVLTYPGDKITVRVKTEDLKRVSKMMGDDSPQPIQPQNQSIQQQHQHQQLPSMGYEKPIVASNRLPPPRVSSELFNQSLAFRPKEMNRPQPILIPSAQQTASAQMAPLPFLTPQTSSSPYSPQSPIMATSPRIRSSFGTDLTAYSLPLTPNSDTRLPVTKKNWLANVLNDDI